MGGQIKWLNAISPSVAVNLLISGEQVARPLDVGRKPMNRRGFIGLLVSALAGSLGSEGATHGTTATTGGAPGAT